MTILKTSCPKCGDVELHRAQLRLVICYYAEWSYYEFRCPGGCFEEVQSPADELTVALLVASGVVPAQWHVPDSIFRGSTRGVITADEVLDFALELGLGSENGVDFDRLALDEEQADLDRLVMFMPTAK